VALDRDTLEQGILAAIKAAAGEQDVDGSQRTLASKIADAVHAYVSAAAVRGVKIDLLSGSPAPQVGDGKLS